MVFPGAAHARSAAPTGLASTGLDETYVRSRALVGQGRVAAVGIAASGPTISEMVFPGAAYARSAAAAGQVWAGLDQVHVRSVALIGYGHIAVAGVPSSGPQITQTIFPGEASACNLTLASQAWEARWG
jgi:hypothetical protein